MATNTATLKRRNGRASFRAVEGLVIAALEARWTVRAIYEEFQARLGMSYAQFARYAQPLRKSLDSQAAALRIATAAPTLRRAADDTAPAAPRKGPPKGRPEDAVPRLDMDGFATRALTKKDLF